jgi:Domain of unknown function (DUF4190)
VTVGSEFGTTTSGKAIAALLLGVAGITVFPLVGIAAIVVGNDARAEIERDPNLGGAGLATAGIILGWISLALLVLGILVVILLLAAW